MGIARLLTRHLLLTVDRIGSANADIKKRTKGRLAKVMICISSKAGFLAILVTIMEQINPSKSKLNQLCQKVCCLSIRFYSVLECKKKKVVAEVEFSYKVGPYII